MNDALLILGIPALIGAAIGYTICFIKMRNATPQHIDLSEIKGYCEDIENRCVSASNQFIRGWFGDDVLAMGRIEKLVDHTYERLREISDREKQLNNTLKEILKSSAFLLSDAAETKEKLTELCMSVNSLSYRPRNIIADRISNKD
ncbi:Uncharacterised protein [Salmonella enterica]|nr:hypothetical protein [Salmonella enterica subsp. salamae]SQJ43417.1 Uncharacterised protein [Salmonella enterica]